MTSQGDFSAEALSKDRAQLLSMLIEKSYQKRTVTLASGRSSDFYIDCRKTALTALGHYLVGRALFAAIQDKAPEAVGVGGLTLGADPLASAVSLTSHLAGTPLAAFLVRKEAKGHGLGQWVEGLDALPKGSKVAILEDVVTTGGSALKAIERARAEGLLPVAAFALVDRQEGGSEAIAAAGVPVFPLFRREDFPR